MHPCRFKIKPFEDGTAEVTAVVPLPHAQPCDTEGPEAIKQLTAWVCSYVVGIAYVQGRGIQELMQEIMATAIAQVDQNVQVEAILQKVFLGSFAPRDLEENPPEGLDSKTTRVLVQKLLDQGTLALDEDLKLYVHSSH